LRALFVALQIVRLDSFLGLERLRVSRKNLAADSFQVIITIIIIIEVIKLELSYFTTWHSTSSWPSRPSRRRREREAEFASERMREKKREREGELLSLGASFQDL